MDSIAAYQRSRPRFDDFPSARRSPAISASPTASRAPPSALPFSSVPLGASFRSRSLDHRRFPFSANDIGGSTSGGGRIYYTSRPGGGIGRTYASSVSSPYRNGYRGELFGEGAKTLPGQRKQYTTQQSSASGFRSSSSDRADGVTVVPIRREATLPARRFEWRTSAAVRETPIVSQLVDTGREQQQAQEYVNFDRAVRYNHQRKVWGDEGARGGGGQVYYPDSTDYTTYRTGQQIGGGSNAAAHIQQSRHHRQHRSHREWESGGGGYRESEQQRHYGTMGRNGTAGRNGGVYQYREEMEGGGGARERYRQEYANGWGGRAKHRGFFGGEAKSKSSSSGARWSPAYYSQNQRGPKRYKKIRCGCFNLIWPPWGVEQTGPPRPMYGNGKELGHRTYERSVPIEQFEHSVPIEQQHRSNFDRSTVDDPADRRYRNGSLPVRSASLEDRHRSSDYFYRRPETTLPRYRRE